MPELPEVENIRCQLEKASLAGETVAQIELFRKDLRWPIPADLKEKVRQQKIESVQRRGKYLLFQLEFGTLISHLGMTGRWRWCAKSESLRKHDHICINLASGRRLVYHDPRRFGMIDWTDTLEKHPLLRELGPEPLGIDFNESYVWQKTRNRDVSIKTWLMDSANVVGIGNIYASEILHSAGISPLRKAKDLRKRDTGPIVRGTRDVLTKAIAAGGSTIRDYKDASGKSGEFQNSHHVYNRAQKSCYKCKSIVKSQIITGRSTYWCPRCQR